MSPAPALASIGDHGVLNTSLSESLSSIWLDRDLSWLDFNERVLAEALDERTPLLERAKFLAIFTSNLDEFFMKRMVTVRGGSSAQQRDLRERLRAKLLASLRLQAECSRNSITPGLAKHGSALRRWDELTSAQQREAGDYFDASLSPALTPLVIDLAHPFPFIANLSTSLVFHLTDSANGEHMFARVKIPAGLRNWVPLTAEMESGQKLFVPLYEIVRGNAHKLYSGMKLTGATLVRLTRDAEVELDDSPDAELREAVEEQVRLRRYEPAVRLEFGPGSDPAIREMMRDRFGQDPSDLYDMAEEVDYTTLFEFMGLSMPELHDAPWTPLPIPALDGGAATVFGAIQAGDILVHHPYESFDASVEHFVSAAADDPQTISIKMTAYRIGDDTPFVKSLIRAAEHGKQVACVMEIKARFDEERNLHWAAQLESVGAHVTFGVRGLKTHGKTALVVRKEPGRLRCYAHIGTGNYHVKTARLYADFGLLTCNPLLTRDVVNLFHYLTGHSQAPDCTTLLVAPTTMRPHSRPDRTRNRAPARRASRTHCRQDESARRPGYYRSALPRLAGGRFDRSDYQRLLLPASRSAGKDREHSDPVDYRPLPGTLPRFPFCERQGRAARRRLLHRLRRLDGTQSLKTRGSSHADFRKRPSRETLGIPECLPE